MPSATGSSQGEAQLFRPPQWDKAEIHGALRDILGERGLTHATIGTDLEYIHQDSLNWLKETNPNCTFVDLTDVLYELRAIKYPREIELLRKGALLFEAGVNRAIAEAARGFEKDGTLEIPMPAVMVSARKP